MISGNGSPVKTTVLTDVSKVCFNVLACHCGLDPQPHTKLIYSD